jgi:hypothetical protein
MRVFTNKLPRRFLKLSAQLALNLTGRLCGTNNRRIKNLESRIKISLLPLCALLALLSLPYSISQIQDSQAAPGINSQINFQARLYTAAGAVVPDGNYNIQFKIYCGGNGIPGTTAANCNSATDEQLLWTESWINNNTQGITVRNGYFSVALGSITSLSSVDFNDDKLWLSLNVGNTNPTCTPFSSCSPDGEMSPFQRFGSNAYAFNSERLGGLQSSAFGQLAANQTWTGTNTLQPTTDITGLIVKQTSAGSPTADILKVQNSSNNEVLSVTSTGAVTLGKASTVNGALVFRNSSNANTIVLQSGVTAASGYTLTLPTALGSSGDCIKDTTGAGVLGFGTCGAGTVTDLQTAYDGSATPAEILLASAKDLVITAPDVATDPNILFNLQCTTCSANGGRFAVQSAGTDALTVSPAGNVGLSTTAPDRVLEINSATGANLRLTYNDNNGSAASFADLGTASSGGLNLSANNLTATGAYGLQGSFTVAGTAASQTFYGQKLSVTNNQTTNANTLYGQHITFTDAGSLSSTLYGLYVDASTANSNDTTYAAIFQGGNVGIGTATPGAKLHANTGADGTIGIISRANSATQSANLLEIQASNGATAAAFNLDGYLGINGAVFGNVGLIVRPKVNTDQAIRIVAHATQSGDLLQIKASNGSTDLAKFSAAGALTLSPSAATSGTPASSLTTTAPSHTTLANAEATDVNFNLARTVQFGQNTTLALQRAALFQAPTYSSSAATKTITDATTLAITGAPAEGTNTDLTNSHALLVQGGAATGATNAYGLTVNAPTSATNNYAAAFLGGNVGIGTASPDSRLHVVGGGVCIEQSDSGCAVGSGNLTVHGDSIFRSSTNSATAFQIQSASAAQTLLSANTVIRAAGTAGNLIKIGDSTGTDLDTTILQVDSTTANPTTNLASLNGGIFYNSTSGKLNIVEGGAVKTLCNTTDLGCGGASGTFVELKSATPDTAQTGHINVDGTIIAGTALKVGTASTTTGSLAFNNSTNSNTVTIQSGVTSGSYSLTLPTAVGALDDCLRTNASGVLSWTACGAASGTMQGSYDASTSPATINTANDKNIVINAADTANDSGIIFNLQCSTCTTGTNSNGGQFQIQAAGTNVFTVAPSGSTGVVTLTGTYLQRSNSATAFVLQNTSSENSLVFDGSTKHLKIYENVGSPTRYADIYYDNATSEAVFTASSGVTRIGSGSGNVTIPLTGHTDVLNFSKTYTASAAYSQSEFNIVRNITGGANPLTGNVAKIEDLSTFTSGSSAPNVLYVNQNNSSATGNLILAQTGGGANDKFKVSTAGTVTIAAGQSYTGAGALSLTSASATSLTIDSGTTGALNLGTGASAKTISIGNATGATSTTIQAGTGGLVLQPITTNTTALTIQDSGGAKFLIVDSTNSRLQVGDTTANSTGTLLVLDTKNTSGDPTGINGAMYYNSDAGRFRCYESGAWKDCLGHRRLITLGSDVASTASTACQDVTGLSFPVVAGVTYRFQAHIMTTASATTIGAALGVNGPAVTSLAYNVSLASGATAVTVRNETALETCTAATASSSTSGNYNTISGVYTPSANGTFQLRFAPETATANGTIVKAGSTLEWW